MRTLIVREDSNAKSEEKKKPAAASQDTDAPPLTKDDIPRLRAQWLEKYADILGGVPERLPPMREINHRIQLIDEGAQYHYHLPRCPDALKPLLMEKIDRYCKGCWIARFTPRECGPGLFDRGTRGMKYER